MRHRHAGADLWSVNYVVCLVCIPVIHLAGNLLNTYYDFKYVLQCPVLLSVVGFRPCRCQFKSQWDVRPV